MVFSPAFLVGYVSRMMTLEAGDLILTGHARRRRTAGAGDVVEVEIERVGILRNRVAGAKTSG